MGFTPANEKVPHHHFNKPPYSKKKNHISVLEESTIYPNTKTKCHPPLLRIEPPHLRQIQCWNLGNTSKPPWLWCCNLKVFFFFFFFDDLFFYRLIWISKYWWVWVSFLDVNYLIWYSFCCILVSWYVLIRFQSGWVQPLNKIRLSIMRILFFVPANFVWVPNHDSCMMKLFWGFLCILIASAALVHDFLIFYF